MPAYKVTVAVNAISELCRAYTFEGLGTVPGSTTAVVQLTQLDNNPANDRDDAVVAFFMICNNPFGNGTRPACPQGTSFSGPANKTIAGIADFATQCCVSAVRTTAGNSRILTSSVL